jgi:hypothetical protein
LVISQILTLYTTPVIYLAFDSLARRRKASPSQPPPAGGRSDITPTVSPVQGEESQFPPLAGEG